MNSTLFDIPAIFLAIFYSNVPLTVSQNYKYIPFPRKFWWLLAISYPNHILCFAWGCIQLSARSSKDRWIWKSGGMRLGKAMYDHKTSLPVRVSLMLTFPSTLLACLSAVRWVRVWMHSLSGSCEGHHQWIMRSQNHLKGHVVWREEEKGQLPSLFERHPARSWVGTLNTTSAELECDWVAWSFSPVSQDFSVMEQAHYYRKKNVALHVLLFSAVWDFMWVILLAKSN